MEETTSDNSPGFIVSGDRAFLRLLDFSKPELVGVKAALAQGRPELATREFIGHFRRKDIPCALLRDSWPLNLDWPNEPRNPGIDTSAADRALSGQFDDGYSVHDASKTGLNWHDCPLSCLTRFPWFASLLQAGYHTGNPKYFRFVIEQSLEYMQAYPIEEFDGKSTRDGWTNHTTVSKPWYWCMIPNRLQEWAAAVNLLRRYDCVTDQELLRLLRRICEEAGYLRTQMAQHVEDRHNGGAAMVFAMAACCAVLDDFTPVREWNAFNARLFVQYVNESFYDDGMFRELTTAYWSSVIYRTLALAYEMRNEDAVKAAKGKFAAMVEAAVGLVKPSGRIPSWGDLYAPPLAEAIFNPALDWLEMPEARTLFDRGPGPLPSFTVWPRPGRPAWSGYYAMRSDWTPAARYLCVDAGPWGTTHRHGDKLSFVLSAFGADFIADPSSTGYASNLPGSFISVAQPGFLHNTITVDGVDEFINSPAETQTPLENTWERRPEYTLFVGDYSFAPVKPVRWQRRILFLQKSHWVLQDVLEGDQPEAEIEQNFQFEPEITIKFDGDTTLAEAPNGARLILKPLGNGLSPKLTVGDTRPHVTYWSKGKPTDVLSREDGIPRQHGRGWVARGGHRLIPAPAVTYIGRVKLPATLTLALIPCPQL